MEIFDNEEISIYKCNLKDYKISFLGISENYISLSIKALWPAGKPQILYNIYSEKFYLSYKKGNNILYFKLILNDNEQSYVLKIAIKDMYKLYIKCINKINEYNSWHLNR